MWKEHELERLVEEGYELLILLPGRSRAPYGWHAHIVQGLSHREQKTEHGIMLSVRTELRSELDRLRLLIHQQPWADEIGELWSRRFHTMTVWTRIVDAPEERASVSSLDMPFTLSRGVQPTIETLEQRRAAIEAARDEEERRQREETFRYYRACREGFKGSFAEWQKFDGLLPAASEIDAESLSAESDEDMVEIVKTEDLRNKTGEG
jgi:hypothetical protein